MRETLKTSQVQVDGPERVFGRIFDEIGFGEVKEELFLLVLAMISCRQDKQTVEMAVDYEEFLSRHDLIWDRIPDGWQLAVYSG